MSTPPRDEGLAAQATRAVVTEHAQGSGGNRRLLGKLVVVVALMFGFGWALIPLYRKICEVTGVNILTGRDPAVAAQARNVQIDASREVIVEFDANRQGPWRFRAEQNFVKVHPGELVHVDYDLVNLEGRTMVGQAIPSYAPQQSAAYFKKVECFCFQQQTLAAGEQRRFPVVFFIDPGLPKDVNQITLSYTFFEVAGATPKAAVDVDAARAAAAAARAADQRGVGGV